MCVCWCFWVIWVETGWKWIQYPIKIMWSYVQFDGFNLFALVLSLIEINSTYTNRIELLTLQLSSNKQECSQVYQTFLQGRVFLIILRESINSQKLTSCSSMSILNCVLIKGKYAIPPLFNYSGVSPMHMFVETFSQNSIFHDLHGSKLAFSYLKLGNPSTTSMLGTSFMTDLNYFKASHTSCISMVILKNLHLNFHNCLQHFWYMLQRVF